MVILNIIIPDPNRQTQILVSEQWIIGVQNSQPKQLQQYGVNAIVPHTHPTIVQIGQLNSLQIAHILGYIGN